MAQFQIKIENGRLIRTRLVDVAQPTLPGPFEAVPPECAVSPAGKHHIVRIQSYSSVRYWPELAYEPWCTFCGKPNLS